VVDANFRATKASATVFSDAYTTSDARKATMLNTTLSLLRPAGMNHKTDRYGFATQSFPPDGLVAVSRIAYESTPLLSELRSSCWHQQPKTIIKEV
jgi:hypothetical protein